MSDKLEEMFDAARTGPVTPSEDLIAESVVDAAFVHARRDQPEPSEMLMARIARDARAQSPRATIWPAAAMLAACAAGIVIGMTDTFGVVSTWTGADDLVMAMPDYGFDLAEES